MDPSNRLSRRSLHGSQNGFQRASMRWHFLAAFASVSCASVSQGTFALALTALFVVSQSLCGLTARAQFGTQIRGPQPGRFIEPPRAILQAINEAERSIQDGRYSEAVVRLGDMLARDAIAAEDADLAGQDFFMDSDTTEMRVDRSMMREAERVLAALPAAGREMYELRYGAKARQMLEEASRTLDRKQLNEVSRRYLQTDAGMDATLLLARLNLSEGRVVAAMAILRRLTSSDSARQRFGNNLLVLLAEAEMLADQEKAAMEHLTAASQSSETVDLAGKSIALPKEEQRAEWLKEQFGSLSYGLSEGVELGDRGTWGPRGGVAGLGVGDGNLPLSRIRWDIPATTSRPQQRTLEEFVAAAGSDAPPPSWQPIKVGSQLLMRTTERLMGIDFETGIRVWEYPWTNGPQGVVSNDVIDVDQLSDVDEAKELLIQRVWNDLPYGRMTSDGKRVYVLDDLGEMEMMPINQFGMPMARGRRPSDTSSNTLVALDLAGQGKLIWMRGKNGIEPPENSLEEAFFLGSPLPVEGNLYQLAELTGDIYLLCLNPETGNELWRQQILGNDGGRVNSDPVRRVSGATPAYSNGILICPTASGAVVAVDLGSRALLWGHRFPRNDRNLTFSGGRNRFTRAGPSQSDLLDRWHDGTPTITGSTVLITPVESDRIYAFDLLTGAPQWSPILRDDFRYMAGCRDGMFFLVASNRMLAFSIQSGQPIWPAPLTLEDGEFVSGTGVFGTDTYFLPTSNNVIVEVELATGKVRSRRQVNYPLGNLLADKGSLISQTATNLSVAFAEQPLRESVDSRFETDADDRWAMVRQGELLLEQGKRDEAIEWLLRAREMDRKDEEVRMLLVDALLTSIRKGKKPDAETTKLLDELIEMAPQRVELLRLKAMAALEEKRPEAAVDFLIELSQIVLREEQTFRNSQARFFEATPTLRTELDTWVAAHLKQAIEMANPSQLENIDAKMAEFVVPRVSDAAPIRKRALAQFGTALAADPLRVGVWSTAMDDGELGRAERIALDAILNAETRGQAGRALTRQWQARLASLYFRSGFDGDALEYARLASADAATEDAGAELLREDLVRTLEIKTSDYPWPAGIRVAAREDQIRAAERRVKLGSIDIVSLRGKHMANWQPKLDRSGAVLLRDPLGLDHRIDLQSSQNANEMVQATIDGGMMVFLTSDELIAVDLLALQQTSIDAVLWRRKWWNQSGARSSRSSRSETMFFQEKRRNYVFSSQQGGRGTAGVMRLGPIVGRRFFFLQGSDVFAIDMVTGEELWRSGGHPSDAFVSASANGVAVVSTDSGVNVLSYDDGSPVRQDLWEPSEVLIQAAGSHLLTLRTASMQLAPATETAETEPNEDNPDSDQKNTKPADPIGNVREIRLRSAIDGTEVLQVNVGEGEAASSTFARIVDGRLMVLLGASGRLVVWDLLEGRSITDQVIEIPGKLTGLNVIRNRNGLVLALVRREDREVDPQLNFIDGPDHTDTDGPLIAIGLDSGEIRWQHDLQGQWGISLDQPGASPLLVLTRTLTDYKGTGRGDRTMDVLAVDTRDGSTAAMVDAMSVISNFTAISSETIVMPERNVVDVAVNRYAFSFEFVDEVVPEDERTIADEAIKKMHEQYRANSVPAGLPTLQIIPK